MSAIETISAWLLSAITAWGAVPKPEHADEIHQRIADSITQVAFDPEEPPIYKGDHGRAWTALVLASIGAEETRFAENVLTGHCKRSQCDNGHATSAWQIHTGRFGVRLLGDKYEQCRTYAGDCYRPEELIANWSIAARVGLHVYRTQGPTAYTTGLKAISQASAWMHAHPAPLKDDEVMGGDNG